MSADLLPEPESQIKPAFSVVTPTHTAPPSIERAIKSVWKQAVGPVEMIIVGDGFDPSSRLAHLIVPSLEHDVRLLFVQTSWHDAYRSAKIANGRNAGTARATAPFIAYLDHDNEFEPDHLERLHEAFVLNPEAEAANSSHLVFLSSGAPWRPGPGGVPWRSDVEDALRVQHRLVGIGNLQIGSNVVISDFDRPRTTVDSNTWMVRAKLMRRLAWPTRYTDTERKLGLNEDRAFADLLRRRGVKVVSTRHPSVKYFVPPGGKTAAGTTHGAAAGSRTQRIRPIIEIAGEYDDHVQRSPAFVSEFPEIANSSRVEKLVTNLGLNDCYDVRTPGGDHHVLKWPALSEHHQRCQNEADALFILTKAGAATPALTPSSYRQGQDGPVIQQALPGIALRNTAENDPQLAITLIQLARAMKRIERSTRRQNGFADSVSGNPKRTWFIELQARALEAVESALGFETRKQDRIRQVAFKVVEMGTAINSTQIEASLCSGDLHSSNILVDKGSNSTPKTSIIDWEWANWADPVTNLDYIVNQYLLNNQDLATQFFGAYGGVPERFDLRADIAVGLRTLRALTGIDCGQTLPGRLERYEAFADGWIHETPGQKFASLGSGSFSRKVDLYTEFIMESP